MKRGFTLVELLVLLAFIGLLLFFVVPNLTGFMKKSDDNKYNAFLNDIFLATEAYIQKNDDQYPTLQSGGVAYVYLSELVNSHLLRSTIYNPKKKEQINQELDYTVVVTKKEDSGYQYELVEERLTSYKENLLNGTDPVIKDNLIAVTIDDTGEVKKADLKSKWYSYEDKKWANAVILKDKSITYSDGETIPESNIESYFVWIPRYKYKLFDLGTYTNKINSKPSIHQIETIDIIFESKGKLVSNGIKEGDYLTHPAFTTLDVNGLWVGKFEITGDTSSITVKPNNSSLLNQPLKTFFELSYNYNRNLDSHMMKNTEWGAVAYLSHSKYGINSEININNNSNYITGYSAVDGTNQAGYPGTFGTDSSITLPYNTTTGYKASTTGNITGIYDMSGGAHEYVAAYMEGNYKDSGFDSTTIQNYDSKYFDIYASNSTNVSFNNRILGDATGELGPFYQYSDTDSWSRTHNNWYADLSSFVDETYPWFIRGGYYNHGVLAGQFYFNGSAGGAVAYNGSRLVLD